MRLGAFIALLVVVSVGGCATSHESRGSIAAFTPDIREVMLASASANDAFPDGKNLVLTHFAYIGTVATQHGPIRVVACRAVIPDMPSPRGQAWVSFHADDGKWLASHPHEPSAPPLWCSGSRIYFFGVQGAGEGSGNALDLQKGVHQRCYIVDPAPGSFTPTLSSGGER